MLARSLFLLLLALLAHWPQLSQPDWHGTEGRRLQIAAEMAHSGNWMVPTLGWEPTFVKPPLQYWLLGAIERLGVRDFVTMRLPAVLGLWAVALLAFALLRRSSGEGAGWVGALGILLAPVLLASTASTEIDPLFTELTAASLFLLAHGVAKDRGAAVVAAGVLGGLAILTKGPPYLMFVAGACVPWWQARGRRHLLQFFVPLLLVPLAYYVPLWIWYVQPSEFGAVAGEESVGRLLGMSWKNVAQTPGYWLKAAAILLPLLAFYRFDRRLRAERTEPAELMLRVCRFGVLGAVVVLTFFPSRPTRYLLPIVPMFVFAMAPAVARYANEPRLGGFARATVRAIGVFGALMLIAVPFVPAPFPGSAPALALGLALLPLLARTPRALVAACLWLPLLGAVTVLGDQAGYWNVGGRGRTELGRRLRSELEALHATDRLQTLGHVNSNLLLGARVFPPGDELLRRPPQQHFVLHETGGWPPLPPMPQYAPRLVLSVPGDVYVLREKRD